MGCSGFSSGPITRRIKLNLILVEKYRCYPLRSGAMVQLPGNPVLMNYD